MGGHRFCNLIENLMASYFLSVKILSAIFVIHDYLPRLFIHLFICLINKWKLKGNFLSDSKIFQKSSKKKLFFSDKGIGYSTCPSYRGYYMATRRYEISFRVLKNISRVKYFSTREEKFRISKRSCNVLFII